MKISHLTPVDQRATEAPRELAPINEHGNTALKQWRLDNRLLGRLAARYLGVSVPTYFRYESGYSYDVRMVNKIVHMTGGAIRYRDLIVNFQPEHA